jgi:hypothetical protein
LLDYSWTTIRTTLHEESGSTGCATLPTPPTELGFRVALPSLTRAFLMNFSLAKTRPLFPGLAELVGQIKV